MAQLNSLVVYLDTYTVFGYDREQFPVIEAEEIRQTLERKRQAVTLTTGGFSVPDGRKTLSFFQYIYNTYGKIYLW